MLGVDASGAGQIYSAAQKLIFDLAGMILKSQQERIQKQLAADISYYDDQADAAKESWEKQKNAGLISEAYYQQQLRAIDIKNKAQKNQADKKAFDDMKERKLAELWINAALAVIVALAESGPIVGAVLGALELVTAGVEAANIESEQWTPKYHSGGVIPGAGEVPITAHGGEAIINPKSMASSDTMTVSGTPYQIASQLNAYKGYGKSFDNKVQHKFMSGGTVIPARPIYSRSASSDDTLKFARYIIEGINNKMVVVQKDIADANKKAEIRQSESTW
jgi:hypothetical protein